jgi:hypothetical protein
MASDDDYFDDEDLVLDLEEGNENRNLPRFSSLIKKAIKKSKLTDETKSVMVSLEDKLSAEPISIIPNHPIPRIVTPVTGINCTHSHLVFDKTVRSTTNHLIS